MSELWTGLSQGLGRTTHPFWVGATQLDPTVGRDEGEAMESCDGSRRAADRLGYIFMITGLKYFC
jgi:hypothetical protein